MPKIRLFYGAGLQQIAVARNVHKLAGSQSGVFAVHVLTWAPCLLVFHFCCAFLALCFEALVLANIRMKENGNVFERNSQEHRPVAARVRVAKKKAGANASPPKNVARKIHDGSNKGEKLQSTDAGVIDPTYDRIFNGEVAGKHHATAADDDQTN